MHSVYFDPNYTTDVDSALVTLQKIARVHDVAYVLEEEEHIPHAFDIIGGQGLSAEWSEVRHLGILLSTRRVEESTIVDAVIEVGRKEREH